MTHGDAVLIISNPCTTLDAKMQALDVIIEDELPSDYLHIRQPIMWDLLKLIYKDYKRIKNNV